MRRKFWWFVYINFFHKVYVKDPHRWSKWWDWIFKNLRHSQPEHP